MLGLFSVVMLAYLPAWYGKFLWDDNWHVTRDELNSLRGLWRIWFELGATQQYYPLTHSIFWLERQLWGTSPLGYHLVSLTLHASVALMVAHMLRKLAIPGAYLAAAIFALHPVHVESVAWISELKNTLSALFYVTAATAYLSFHQSRRPSLKLFALGLFCLGLLSKSVIATLPAALLVIIWWQKGRLSWREDIQPLFPFFTVAIISGVFTIVVEQQFIGAKGSDFQFGFVERTLIAGRAVWFYLGKNFFPLNLSFIYPRWTISETSLVQYLFPVTAIIFALAFWMVRHKNRTLLAGFLFFIGTLFPALGFVNVYPFRFSFVADHFQYLASLGIVVLTASTITLLTRRFPRPAFARILCFALLGILGASTWQQSGNYKDVQTLYKATISRNPQCWLAHNNLGIILFDQGKNASAITHFQRAIALKPDYPEAHYNLANAYGKLNQLGPSIHHLEEAVALKPEYSEARENLGISLGLIGRHKEAVDQLKRAAAIRINDGKVRNALGVALAQTGQIDEAIQLFQEALEILPRETKAHNKLGNALTPEERSDVYHNLAMALNLKQNRKSEKNP